VVVVGAGHNGLVCAVDLARAGFGVTVFEQAEHPGGAVSSHTDTLPGFVHDRCAGCFPLTQASPAFDGLDVPDRLAWANPDVAMAYPFADGSAIALHRDLDATVASLESAAPGAGRPWLLDHVPHPPEMTQLNACRATRRPQLPSTPRRRRGTVPANGSRFTVDGEILNGPATTPLERCAP